MSKRQAECIRCHTVRFLDRLRKECYDGTVGWTCTGKTACKQRRKTGNKLFRAELWQRRNGYLDSMGIPADG